MPELTAKPFDYAAIDAEGKSKLIWLAGEINKQKSSGLQAMLDMGKAVADAQEILASHHKGSFGKWIEAECGIGRSSAYRYLHAWEKFGSCASLGQLTAEAMYALSSPDAPPEAAKQAQKLADRGVKVTAKVAKELVGPKPARNGSKATSFNTDELDKQPPAKAPKRSGKPIVTKKERTEVQKHLGGLIRCLKTLELYDEFEPSLSAIAKRLKQI